MSHKAVPGSVRQCGNRRRSKPQGLSVIDKGNEESLMEKSRGEVMQEGKGSMV